MKEYLNDEEIDNLSDKIYSALIEGYTSQFRRVILAGMNSQFVATLNNAQNEKLQLDLDLAALNRTPKLTDGTIPFQFFLQRILRRIQHVPEVNDVIQLALAAISSRYDASIEKPIAPSAKIIAEVKEKVVHQNDMVAYSFLEAGARAGNSVARMRVPRYENGQAIKRNDNNVIYLGTSWLLTADLVITNYHVINARENDENDADPADFVAQAAKTIVQFDYNSENVEGINANVLKVEASNKELDYAILRLAEPVERSPLRLLPVSIVIPANEIPVVNIIQHPGGNAKRVALRNNHIYDIAYPAVRYFTDTIGGSSGSPVFNDNWQVVALHRASTLVNNVKYNGQETGWINEGIQLEAIMADLRANFKSIADEIENQQ